MRTLIMYAFHNLNENLLFFIKHAIINSSNIFYLFIGNCKPITLNLPSYVNIKIVFRDNVGYDFGAWSYGLFHVNDIKMDEFDYFMFINQTAKGPFLPSYYKGSWVDIFTDMINDTTKLVGTTMGFYNSTAYVQSMLLATDEVGLHIGVQEGIFSPNIIDETHTSIVINKEVRYSNMILKHNFNINCTMKLFHNLNFLQEKDTICKLWKLKHYDVNHPYGYIGTSLDPYDVVFLKTNRNIDNYRLELYSQIKDNVAIYDMCWSYFNEMFNVNTIENLDPDFFWKTYADLEKEKVDPLGLNKYFDENAVAECRIGSQKCLDLVKSHCVVTRLPKNFNWKYYIENYKDLAVHGIDTEYKAVIHYLRFGINEQRVCDTILNTSPETLPTNFNWKYYVENNPDLPDHGIDTKEKSIEHFLQFGQYEHRIYDKKYICIK